MKELGPYHSAILTGGKVKTLLSRVVNNVIVLMLIVNVVNEDKPEQVLLSEVTEDVAVEQVLLVNGDHVDVNNANADVVNDVNVDVNEDNPEQILLTVVTEVVDVEQVLLENVDHVDVNTETVENADVDVNAEDVDVE